MALAAAGVLYFVYAAGIHFGEKLGRLSSELGQAIVPPVARTNNHTGDNHVRSTSRGRVAE